MEKKNSVTFIVAIICIVLCIPLGIIIGMHLSVNEENRNVTNNIVNNTVNNSGDKETLSIDSQIVADAMKSFDGLYITDSELYKDGGYKISSITDYDLLRTSIKHIEDEKISSDCLGEEKIPIPIADLNFILSKYLLDRTINLDSSETPKNYNEKYLIIDNKWIVYISNNEISISLPCGGPIGIFDYIDKKIISAEKAENYVYVYEKVVFASYNEDYVLSYYKDYQNNILVENNVYSVEEHSDNKEPNWDLYDTYKYTFKVVNGKYYFQSYELVND